MSVYSSFLSVLTIAFMNMLLFDDDGAWASEGTSGILIVVDFLLFLFPIKGIVGVLASFVTDCIN